MFRQAFYEKYIADLELRICEELFPDQHTVLSSKLYEEKDIENMFG